MSTRTSRNTTITPIQQWNILDLRFFSIWFVISNIPGFVEKQKYVEGMYAQGVIKAVIATFILLVLIPVILLLLSENTPLKRLFLWIFGKLNWLYHAVGWACFSIMIVYLVLFTIEKIGIKIPL